MEMLLWMQNSAQSRATVRPCMCERYALAVDHPFLQNYNRIVYDLGSRKGVQ
jgi:hypothetical protein